jgi:hypothetical protein
MTHLRMWCACALVMMGCSSSPPALPADDNTGEGETDIDGIGETCTFNNDCNDERLRCACTDGVCACEVGQRGAGRSGLDRCSDGNDCETSLCVEDADNGFTCSGPCATDDDCGERLPRCLDVALLGRICVRRTS